MKHTTALISSKGGVGKTTVALNLSVALAERGVKTLLVDLDPQGGIGFSLAKGDTEWCGLAEYLAGNDDLDSVVIDTKLPTLSIVPRGRLDPIDVGLYEDRLRSADAIGGLMGRVSEQFDAVLIDTPSGLGPITRTALSVASHAVVVLQAEPLGLRSAVQALRVIEHVQESDNPRLRLAGILPTMVQLDEDASLNVMSTIWRGFDGVFDTCIPRSQRFARASERGLPLTFLAGRTPPEGRRFELLAEELERTIAWMEGTTEEEDAAQERQLV